MHALEFAWHRFAYWRTGVVLVLFVFSVAANDADPFGNSDYHDDLDSNVTDLSTELPTDPFPSQPVFDFLIPSCEDGEFLRSNGSHVHCVEIQERTCRCPGPTQDPTGLPVTELPTPPLGCPVMTPPKDGAFVCTLIDGDIYCSVMCSPASEFASYPDNPYQCGSSTKFHWVNFFGECFNQLPQCHGFRYSIDSVFDNENYLPAVCQNLSIVESDQVKRNFCNQLDFWYFLMCSSMEDVFIQCGMTQ